MNDEILDKPIDELSFDEKLEIAEIYLNTPRCCGFPFGEYLFPEDKVNRVFGEYRPSHCSWKKCKKAKCARDILKDMGPNKNCPHLQRK